MQYELVIIGGGPAGAAAAVYAARKQIKTLVITESWGGQSTESTGIQNWIGTIEIPGIEFGKVLRNHVVHYGGSFVDMKESERVEQIIRAEDWDFLIKTNKGEYKSKTILITTGSSRRKLEIPGAKEFENKGIVYCASCDGPLFAGQEVAVIGGGNAGFESAAQLLAYCKSVTLLNRSEVFKADPVTIESVRKHPNARIIVNAVPLEIRGDKFVNALVYEDLISKERHELRVTGVFVEIGLIPTTGFAESFGLEMNQIKQIKVDPKNQRTNLKGVWAAGDCTDGLFDQNNIAAGDAVKALEDIYLELHKMK